jgi:MFS family permease
MLRRSGSRGEGGPSRDRNGGAVSGLAALLRLVTVDTSPLRHSGQYRLLYGAQTVSFLGTALTMVAFPFQVYALTRSSLAVGMLGLAELVPLLALAVLGGALADAHDRRLLVRLTEGGLALCAAALAANALAPHPALWLLYVAAGAMAGLDALQRPALDSLVPRIVAPEHITPAAALGALRSTLIFVAGPAVAGIVIATLGLGAAYGLDALSFAVSFALLARMRPVPPTDAAPVGLSRIVEGLRYAKSRPDLLGSYAVDWLAMLFGMPSALFPAIASAYGGATVLGFFYAAPAFGAMLVSATSGWTARVSRYGRAIIISAAVWGLAIVAFGLAHSLVVALAMLALAGGADMVSGVFRGTLWNRTVPDALRGRLAAIEFVSYSSGPALGNVEAGVVAALFSARTSVISGGILCIAGVIAAALTFRALWRYEPAATERQEPTSRRTSA